jgi:hypothetical protein
VIRRVVWSPVEVDYLKQHKDYPINQLCISLAKSRYAIKKKLQEISTGSSKQPIKKKTFQSKIGKRVDCHNMFFRSAWEANVYRLLRLDKSIVSIEYEPTDFTFWQFGIKKGTVSYTPDFKVTYEDGSYLWIEVKGGWMRASDKTKLRRFKKYYPGEFDKLVAVGPGPTSATIQFFNEMGVPVKWHYPDLNKQYRHTVPNWE